MKKNQTPLIIVGVVVVILAIGAFFFLRGSSNPLGVGSGSPQDLMASALTGSGSVVCEYTDEDGSTVTAYVRNGMVRTNITGGPEGDGSFLMRDKTVWTWQDSTMQGMMYVIPDVTPVEGEAVESETNMADEVSADLEQYKDSCRSESIPDSVFEVPSGVNFQDYSQMMQGAMQDMQMQAEQLPLDYQQYLNQ